jgi:hypothetical protein
VVATSLLNFKLSFVKIILSGLAGLLTKPLPENVISLNTLPIL